jgi:polysaccharide export outer membrane protein
MGDEKVKSQPVRITKCSTNINQRLTRTATAILAIIAATLFVPYADAAVSQQKTAYLLGPGDIVTINVQRHPEFSGEFLVPYDGQLNIAAVGMIPAAGRTVVELEQDIADKLKNRIREPEVTVSLKSPREQKVYVAGAVKTPGAFDLKPGWKVMEAITAAGGLLQEIDYTRCTVIINRSANNEKLTFQLSDMLRGDSAANPALSAGDVIMIDAGDIIPIYVTGKVKSPGLYRLGKDDANVLKAIALAGGALQDASLSNVKIVHLSGSSQIADVTNNTNTQQSQNLKLQPGDLIIVPENTARVAVLGYVGEPGFFPLPEERKFMLSDALAMAKGFENKRAGLETVAVIRTENGKQSRMIFDVGKFLKNGDITQNPELMAGDVIYVPQTGRVDWESVLRSIASVGVFISPFTK